VRTEILKFFNLQRQIFGICPECREFFRLSECKVYLKAKPTGDWMDGLLREEDRLGNIEERLDEKEEEMREKAREKGRRLAQQAIRKIDPVFTPRKLNPDDAKVVFHPIDYVVFNGMRESESMENIVFLDRESRSVEHRRLQVSIERVIARSQYE
jgi:predicted Holliday junction resolvase-like endonuclease